MSKSNLGVYIPKRDYSDLNRNDVQLRVWLPEPAMLALDDISSASKTDLNDYLVRFFAVYAFGYFEVQRMRAEEIGLYEPKPIVRYCAMGVTGAPPAPDLGQNIHALKIYVPRKVKQTIRSLADQGKMTVGAFCRSLICAHLFGREYGPKKLMGQSKLNDSVAAAWEADEEDEVDE